MTATLHSWLSKLVQNVKTLSGYILNIVKVFSVRRILNKLIKEASVEFNFLTWQYCDLHIGVEDEIAGGEP